MHACEWMRTYAHRRSPAIGPGPRSLWGHPLRLQPVSWGSREGPEGQGSRFTLPGPLKGVGPEWVRYPTHASLPILTPCGLSSACPLPHAWHPHRTPPVRGSETPPQAATRGWLLGLSCVFRRLQPTRGRCINRRY